MNDAERYKFLFQLYEYAYLLGDEIESGTAFDASNNFLMMVFIEKFFDRTGRIDVSDTAKRLAGGEYDEEVYPSNTHKLLDALRSRLDSISRSYDFDRNLDYTSEQIASEWRHSHHAKDTPQQ